MNREYDIDNEINNDNYVPKHANMDTYKNTNNLNYNYNTESKYNDFLSSNNYDNKIEKYNDTNNTIATNNNNNAINNNVTSKKKKTTRKRKNTNIIWTILMLIFIFIMTFCIIKIFFWSRDNKKTKDMVNDIENSTIVNEVKDDENTILISEEEDKSSDYWYYISFPLIDVDINSLKEKNSDTVGFINVNNTNINYPFVHYKDNSFYLDHSYDKSYNEAGWVFMDYRNSANLDNKNTILYAHSRLDKTMFGSLSKTLKSSWFTNRDNHIIRLSMENENTMWQIFSVYKIVEESYYITTDFTSDDEYSKFLTTIKSRSIYDFNTNLSTSDKILTLSTCYSDTERTVVHAKLIKRSTK